MDRLQLIWAEQEQQQRDLGLAPENMDPIEHGRMLKDYALGLYEEVQELARSVAPYKVHILKTAKAEKLNVAEGVADVLKYTIAIAQMFGISPEELVEGFRRRTLAVRAKAEGSRLELERNTRLIATDLDGCVADLSNWQNSLAKAKEGGGAWDTVDALEALRNDFYLGGGFLDLPVYPGAVQTLVALKQHGYKIVIVTARPQWQYKRIHADTLLWLKKHGIPCDLLLFNKDKSEALYEHVFPAKPVFFIEDRDKHALELVNIGVRVVLLDRPWNQDVAPHQFITRVKSWEEIQTYAEQGG